MMASKIPSLLRTFPRFFSPATVLLVVSLLLGAFLRFDGLGSTRLWQDEADFANNALSILETGWPKAEVRGINNYNTYLWSHYPGDPSSIDKYKNLPYLNRQVNSVHTWLPFYSMAASILIGERSSFYARLPSALLGTASILVFFWLLTFWVRSGSAALGAFIFSLNMYFMREARSAYHHAYELFFALLVLVAVSALLRKSTSWRWGFLFFSLLGLFQSYVVYFGVLGCASFVLLFKTYRSNRCFWLVHASLASFAIAWLTYLKSFFSYSLIPLHKDYSRLLPAVSDLWQFQLPSMIFDLSIFGLCVAWLGLTFRTKQSGCDESRSVRYLLLAILGLALGSCVSVPTEFTAQRLGLFLVSVQCSVVFLLDHALRRMPSGSVRMVFAAVLLIHLPFAGTSYESIHASITDEEKIYSERIDEALRFFRDHGVDDSELILANYDNTSYLFHSSLNVHWSWAANEKAISKLYRTFWYVLSDDDVPCSFVFRYSPEICQRFAGDYAHEVYDLNQCEKFELKRNKIFRCPLSALRLSEMSDS